MREARGAQERAADPQGSVGRDGSPREFDRRSFLSASGIGVLGLAAAARIGVSRSLRPTGPGSPSPFTLGVASGDPRPDSVVLWTRLAPDPSDPTGGMSRRDVTVRWEVATDERMRKIVASGRATARARHAHTVHVDVGGLEPAHTYWYRFRARGAATEPARTRTAPARGAMPKRLRIGQVSCQRFDQGYYTAYADLAEHPHDLVVHLGDYIYESSGGPVRDHGLDQPVDLDGYRLRYAHYKQDRHLQAAHALAPWVVTWDDHEVEDNYMSDESDSASLTPDRKSFLRRRAAAYQAWWEHQPVRFRAPTGPDLRIYRRLRFGRLADLHMLDTRQYRSPQCGDGEDIGPRCPESSDPDFTVLGPKQERWLDRGLRRSDTRWNVLGNQIVAQQWRFAPGNAVWNLDQWDGYPAARDRLYESLVTAGGTPVVLTGDVHSSWVGSLAVDLDDPDSPSIGTEFVGPGVSSAPSSLLASTIPAVMENSPHIRWVEGTKRGWVRHVVTPNEWRAEYRLVDDALVDGSPVRSAAKWTVDRDGEIDGP